MSDDWFWFQHNGRRERPDTFQSPYLDDLFLKRSDVRIGGAWCISSRDRQLIYFWGDRTAFDSHSDVPGQMGYYIRKFRPFFEMLQSSGVLELRDVFRTDEADPIKYVASRPSAEGFNIEICAGRSTVFLYQLKSPRAPRGTDDLDLRTYLLALSEGGYELFLQAAPFLQRIPRCVLNIDQAPDALLDQYFGPACYDPSKRSNTFAWPWQRGREQRDGLEQPLGVPTISLCMDLRNSTSAMLLTRNPAMFSAFIDHVVESARDTITQKGGYFDKETGDGVVGHFEVPTSWAKDAGALNSALSAAKCISERTARLCKSYQENLNLRLGGLGCAIGLFAGSAVWLYSWRGVRAIGESAVNANRICSNAGPGEVGYCNTIAHLIERFGIPEDVFPRVGVARPIRLHEVRDTAVPEAWFVHIN